jgi:putative photosynthetic complex assembly protein 2
MRTSAKLNLFLGVRNLSEAFLPAHLAYLESFFRRRPMNLLFPVSVIGASLVLGAMVKTGLEVSATDTEVLGISLVGTMLGLAILEHWLLVLPLDTTALWRWAIREAKNRRETPAASDAANRPLSGLRNLPLESDEKLLRAR